jgi:hypothetical protein
MRISRRARAAAVAGAVGLVVASLLPGSTGQAATPATVLVSARNASDPSVFRCGPDLCMYASSDLLSGGYTGNPYPMNATYLYRLPAGRDPGQPSNWIDHGAVLTEQVYVDNGWVPSGANHLWAPTMSPGRNGADFGYYLYVPDVTDRGADGVHKTSKIGVSYSSSPTGPFRYLKRITYQGQDLTGYMSDPSVFNLLPGLPASGGRPAVPAISSWLLWANGDYETCGGFSIAQLDPYDMTSLITAPQEIQITNLPSGMNSCTRQLPQGVPQGTPGYSGTVNHAYMEGADLYDFGMQGIYPHGDRFVLLFAIKPNSTPSGCDSANEAIAYATANDPRGPYTYRNIVMCGSNTEWTNQASLYAYSVPNSQGLNAIFFYHDASTNSGSAPQDRKVSAECITITNNGIPRINRSATFSSCMPSRTGWGTEAMLRWW